MKHLSAIIIKFIMIAVILEILLNLMTDLTFMQILGLSAVISIAAYLIGDLLILSISNNTVATIADIGVVLAVILLYDYWRANLYAISFTDVLISAVVIAVGEWFFHKYVSERVFPDRHETHA